MSTKNIYEIFDEFEKAETDYDRVCVLRFNESWAMKNVLRGAFDPNVRFVIERVPYYKPSDAPIAMGYTSITQELGRAYIFEDGNPRVEPNLTYDRKEKILIQILESLEKREAEVFMNMIMKNLKVKNLDYRIVKEAFPDLLPAQ